MTIYEWQATAIEGAAGALAHWIGTTRPDRLDWCPKAEEESNTRSALDMVKECVGINRMLAGLLKGSPPPADSGHHGNTPDFASGADAQEQLIASAKELADVVRSLDPDALGRTYQTPFGALPGAFLIQLPAMNMTYHGGQVNYMQRLYGDTVFSFPGM